MHSQRKSDKCFVLSAVEQDGKQQSFHVVVPSMPGFAFSGQPKRPGYGPRQMGEAVNTLMVKLGYNRYVAQGAAHRSTRLLLHVATLSCSRRTLHRLPFFRGSSRKCRCGSFPLTFQAGTSA